MLKTKKQTQSDWYINDRFIPIRCTDDEMELKRSKLFGNSTYIEAEEGETLCKVCDNYHMENILGDGNASSGSSCPGYTPYNEVVRKSIFGSDVTVQRMLDFVPKQQHTHSTLMDQVEPIIDEETGSTGGGMGSSFSKFGKRYLRKVSEFPHRVLDCPDIIDDYYLNPIDWSSQNILAVALHDFVYLWNAGTGDITELFSVPYYDDYVSSVAWSACGKYLAAGISTGSVMIYDVETKRRMRLIDTHDCRVSSLVWNGESSSLYTGSRDYRICHLDISRIRPFVENLTSHEGEICSLTIDKNQKMLASGSNDNHVRLWDIRKQARVSGVSGHEIRHQSLMDIDTYSAAVKGLRWSPFNSNRLATGGGTSDPRLCLWDLSGSAPMCILEKNLMSQITSIQWPTQHPEEILTSHGYMHNTLRLWHWPSMKPLSNFRKHGARVLCTTMSPDGTMVAAASGDETMTFWDIFGGGGSGSSDDDGVKVGKKRHRQYTRIGSEILKVKKTFQQQMDVQCLR